MMPIPYMLKYCVKQTTEGPGVSVNELYELWCGWCKREGLGTAIGKKSTFLRTVRATIPNTTLSVVEDTSDPDRRLRGIELTDWASKELRTC